MKHIKIFETTAARDAFLANAQWNVLEKTIGVEGVELHKYTPAPRPTFNTIRYTTSDNEPLFPDYDPESEPRYMDPGNENNKLISDIYENGEGVLTFENNITMCGERFLGYSNTLTSIILPEGVTTLDSYAFDEVTYADFELTLPSTVTYIDCLAFQYLSGEFTLNINAIVPPEINLSGGDLFTRTDNYTIYVPAGSVNAYKTAWADYSEHIFAMQ